MNPTSIPIRDTITDIPTSAIRQIATIGMQMDDVIPFWFGEPDAPTPDFIVAAGTKALQEGKTYYTLNRGILELREALAVYMGGSLRPRHRYRARHGDGLCHERHRRDHAVRDRSR